METTDIKDMWRQTCPQNRIDIHGIIRQRHCRAISRSISGYRVRTIVWFCSFSVVVLLFLYAFVWRNIPVSMTLAAPLTIAGLFLFMRFLADGHRYRLLRNDYDHQPVIEAEKLIDARLKRIRRMDFLSYIVLFYSIAAVLFLSMWNDPYLEEQMGAMIWILIVILFGMPWFTSRLTDRKRHRRR